MSEEREEEIDGAKLPPITGTLDIRDPDDRLAPPPPAPPPDEEPER